MLNEISPKLFIAVTDRFFHLLPHFFLIHTTTPLLPFIFFFTNMSDYPRGNDLNKQDLCLCLINKILILWKDFIFILRGMSEESQIGHT